MELDIIVKYIDCKGIGPLLYQQLLYTYVTNFTIGITSQSPDIESLAVYK